MVNLTLFYRDGDNYKCTWNVQIDKITWNNFLENNTDMISDDFLDPNLESENLFQIYELNLSMNDIPLIAEHGMSNRDHPYVSIVKYKEVL